MPANKKLPGGHAGETGGRVNRKEGIHNNELMKDRKGSLECFCIHYLIKRYIFELI